jgi:hypothetical protein
VFADGARHSQHVTQIGGSIFIGRGTHGDELEQAMLHALFGIGGEAQPSGIEVALHHRVQARLVDGQLAALQHLHFPRVHVDAHHVIAGVSQTGTCDQTHVTGTEYGDFHP